MKGAWAFRSQPPLSPASLSGPGFPSIATGKTRAIAGQTCGSWTVASCVSIACCGQERVRIVRTHVQRLGRLTQLAWQGPPEPPPSTAPGHGTVEDFVAADPPTRRVLRAAHLLRPARPGGRPPVPYHVSSWTPAVRRTPLIRNPGRKRSVPRSSTKAVTA